MCTEKKARIAYDGPLLSDGSMDVRELAPALIAFADLVKYSGKAIGIEQPIKVLLNQDSLQRGSFDITFLLDLNILEQAKLFVKGAENSGLKDLMDVLGWGATIGACSGGIFGIVKYIGGRKIKAIDQLSGAVAKITLADGVTLEVTENALKVLLDYECRKSLEKITAPLKNHGISSFKLRNPDSDSKEPIETISKEDVEAFKTPDVEDAITNVYSGTMIFDIESVVFDEEKKWRFFDGEVKFWARIEDVDFWRGVEDGSYRFAKGDRLEVQCTISQSTPAGGHSTLTRTITKVVKKLDRPKQIKLDFGKR